MFVDQAEITVRAGNGGRGAIAFRREAKIPKGGPSGGDGGRGGDVILLADQNINTLLDFAHRVQWKAHDGEPGRAKQQYGLAGEDLVIRVPPGTMVYDRGTGELLADLAAKEHVVIAKGGKGGYGNEHYKSPTNQTPRKAGPGEPGEQRALRLELRLIADVGIVGLPNAGKSTLLSAISDARPKIADYPFTTLTPQLGIAELDQARRLVFADIPGLIEGASAGAGLGHEFLRHIERTRVLVHLIDIAPSPTSHAAAETTDPAHNYQTIRQELEHYSPILAEKPEIIVLNKVDVLDEDELKQAISTFRKKLKLGRGDHVLTISAATRQGTSEMLEAVWAILNPRVEKWKAGVEAGVVERADKPKPARAKRNR